jgi:hypothetical protein
MVGRNVDAGSKNTQFSLFLELLEDREENGDHFNYPGEDQIPTEQLEMQDTMTEGQSIKIVGAIMKQLEARRNARY